MKGSNSRLALYGLLFAALFVTFHRPLPENFTDTIVDKAVMYFMEVLLRFSYVYPTRFCPDAYCQVQWTRFTLEHLLKIVGPWTLNDPEVEIKDIELGGVPTRAYAPYNRSNDGAIVFIHGGGFVIGNVHMYESMVRQIAKDSRMVTFSLDYRLAPEHAFPAGLDDCERAVTDLLKQVYKQYGINRERVALMGDSAGAGLIASLTYRFRHRTDIPQPKTQVLIYPLLQVHNLRMPSYDFYYRKMPNTAFVDPRLVAQYYLMYAGVDLQTNAKVTPMMLDNKHLSPHDRREIERYIDVDRVPEDFRYGLNVTRWHELYDEQASRLLAPFLQNPEFTPIVQPDLSGVPPALVVTMEFDVLRDEGLLYAQRLRDAGIPTTWKHYPTGFHAMFNFRDTISTAERALREIALWTRNHV